MNKKQEMLNEMTTKFKESLEQEMEILREEQAQTINRNKTRKKNVRDMFMWFAMVIVFGLGTGTLYAFTDMPDKIIIIGLILGGGIGSVFHQCIYGENRKND